jgi:hypothetical protein
MPSEQWLGLLEHHRATRADESVNVSISRLDVTPTFMRVSVPKEATVIQHLRYLSHASLEKEVHWLLRWTAKWPKLVAIVMERKHKQLLLDMRRSRLTARLARPSVSR